MDKNKRAYESQEEEEEEVEEPSERGGVAFRKFIQAVKENIFQPFFYGTSGAFGLCCGYALFDWCMANWQRIPLLVNLQQALTNGYQH